MYRASWPLDSVTAATEPPSADPHLAYIYPTKMQPSLARTLVNAGLAEFGPSHPDIGLGLHPQLANVYMLTLARTAAKNTGYHPVTDETRNHVGMAACTLAALVEALLGKVEVASPIDRRSEAESLLLNMAFTAVMPVNLEHVPMEKIIEVRNTWSTERWQFQEGLKTILNGLGENLNVLETDAYRRHIEEEFEKKVMHPLEGLKKQLARANLGAVAGSFSLTTVVPAGALLATLPPEVAWFGAIATLALGLYKLLSAHRAKQEELMKSPVAYLVRLERELPPSSFGSWIDGDVRCLEFGPLP